MRKLSRNYVKKYVLKNRVKTYLYNYKKSNFFSVTFLTFLDENS